MNQPQIGETKWFLSGLSLNSNNNNKDENKSEMHSVCSAYTWLINVNSTEYKHRIWCEWRQTPEQTKYNRIINDMHILPCLALRIFIILSLYYGSHISFVFIIGA